MPRRYPLILHVALPVPLRRCFDYFIDSGEVNHPLEPGSRVRVPFGKTEKKTGILIGTSNRSSIDSKKLKEITGFIDSEPLFPGSHLELLQWASEYYQHPIGEVIFSTLPVLLKQGKPLTRKPAYIWHLTDTGKAGSTEIPKHASRQIELMELLRSSPEGIPEQQLKGKNLAPALKSLLHRGYIEKSEYQESYNHVATRGPEPTLNDDQARATVFIKSKLDEYQRILLNGVTGSGKTEIYIDIARTLVQKGKQILVLVPEIGLTPQLVHQFRDRINARIVVMHSGLSNTERLQSWNEAGDGTASVLLGTRSAIWAPMKYPGAIIIDEEHDLSYKQQEGFRYCARDVAIMRAKMEDIPVILGSATPSMESLQNVKNGRFSELILANRINNTLPPEVTIIDMRAQQMAEAFSRPLLSAMEKELTAGRQVLLFLNKRGFSPVIMCHTCGWIAKCQRCEISMTYHKSAGKLLCHHCLRQTRVVAKCGQCNSNEIVQVGHGTERLEETLTGIFPQARVLRIDRDSTRRKGAMQRIVETINAGDADILIGTQMLAKGHHFPNLNLVGIIDADRGLFSSDFRGSEYMAQLIIQVSGRAGRITDTGRVLIQTHQPQHPLLQSLVNNGYGEFARTLLHERRQTNLPPFTFLALLRAESHEGHLASKFLTEAKALIQKDHPGTEIFGPVPAPMEKRSGRLRFQLLIQSTSRNRLMQILRPWSRKLETLLSGKKVRWSLDIDPRDML